MEPQVQHQEASAVDQEDDHIHLLTQTLDKELEAAKYAGYPSMRRPTMGRLRS